TFSNFQIVHIGLLFVRKGSKRTMKKISLFALTLFFASSLFAQDAKFGLKAGLNVSTLSNTYGSEYGSKLGFNAGALAHIHLSPYWSLQPEVLYSGQGTKYTVGTTEHTLGLGY